MDVLTKEQRRRNMQAIKSKDTSIERILRKKLWQKGYRYRKNYKKLPGKPDIVLTKYRIAIFCDSEFWHGKDWGQRKMRLKSNREYWIEKIEENIARDIRNDNLLVQMGWTPIHFWEEDILRDLENCVTTIVELVLDLKASSIDETEFQLSE